MLRVAILYDPPCSCFSPFGGLTDLEERQRNEMDVCILDDICNILLHFSLVSLANYHVSFKEYCRTTFNRTVCEVSSMYVIMNYPYALRLRKGYDPLKLREHNASFSQQKESTANTLFVQDLDFRSCACFKHLQGLQELIV